MTIKSCLVCEMHTYSSLVNCNVFIIWPRSCTWSVSPRSVFPLRQPKWNNTTCVKCSGGGGGGLHFWRQTWTPLGFNDVIVDMVFMWCVSISILGYLFLAGLKKSVVLCVQLKLNLFAAFRTFRTFSVAKFTDKVSSNWFGPKILIIIFLWHSEKYQY